MKATTYLICITMSLLFAVGCQTSTSNAETSNQEQQQENPLNGIGKVEVVATGFKSTEGPVWDANSHSMLFTDIPGNSIYRFQVNSQKLSVFRSPSNTSNGLALDNDGYLLAAEQKTRSITRINLETKKVMPLIDSVELDNKQYRFNSPNDMAVHKTAGVYFTDPPYGLRGRENEKELSFQGVFVRKPDGAIKLLRAFPEEKPNGIVFNKAQSILYVAISDDISAPILAYDVNSEGDLSNEREFTQAQNADGMAIDVMGNLYVATRTGIRVFSPSGKEWGRIDLPDNIRTTNCAFGGDNMDTLYITSRSADLYAVKLNTKGF